MDEDFCVTPRYRSMDGVQSASNDRGIKEVKVRELATDGSEWRTMVYG